MRRVPGAPGFTSAIAASLRGEHQLVDVALRAAEAPVHRERAGDVGGVAVELAAGVDQQQRAVLEQRVVLAVVQHAGVGAAGDDRPVGRELRAVAAELVQQLGLDLVLHPPAAWRASRARARRRRSRRRGA